jgi:hypothetical protein
MATPPSGITPTIALGSFTQSRTSQSFRTNIACPLLLYRQRFESKNPGSFGSTTGSSGVGVGVGSGVGVGVGGGGVFAAAGTSAFVCTTVREFDSIAENKNPINTNTSIAVAPASVPSQNERFERCEVAGRTIVTCSASSGTTCGIGVPSTAKDATGFEQLGQ